MSWATNCLGKPILWVGTAEGSATHPDRTDMEVTRLVGVVMCDRVTDYHATSR